MSVTVYGSGDDLIVLSGDVREEFDYDGNDGDGDLLAFSTGHVLRVKFEDSGVWRITPVAGKLSIEQAEEGDDENYTDVATVAGDVDWVVHGDVIVH